MLCCIAQLQYKEVIDVATGARYGFVDDVELDLERGAIQSIILRGRPRWFGLFGREQDVVIPWDCVKRFGEDVVLVDGGALSGWERNGANFFLSKW